MGPGKGTLLVPATPSEGASQGASGHSDSYMKRLLDATQEDERQPRKRAHYAEESLNSSEGSSFNQSVGIAQRQGEIHAPSNQHGASLDHADPSGLGFGEVSQPNIGAQVYKSPAGKAKRKTARGMPKTVESQTREDEVDLSKSTSHRQDVDEIEAAGGSGPNLRYSLGSGTGGTQGMGAETQAWHAKKEAQHEAELAARSKRKRGAVGPASSEAPSSSLDHAPPQPNENADPSSSSSSSERSSRPIPFSASNAEGAPSSSAVVSKALVPSPQRRNGRPDAPVTAPLSPVPSSKRLRTQRATTTFSSSDATIDPVVLIARSHADGGPLQSTCPPRAAALMMQRQASQPQQTPSSCGAVPADHPVDSTAGSGEGDRVPTNMGDSGASRCTERLHPFESSSNSPQRTTRAANVEDMNDDDDGLLDANLFRPLLGPKSGMVWRTTSAQLSGSSRWERSPPKKKQKNVFALPGEEGSDDELEGVEEDQPQGQGAQDVGSEKDESEDEPTPRPSPQRHQDELAGSGTREGGETQAAEQRIDQLLAETPEDPPASRPSLTSSLGKFARGATATTEDDSQGRESGGGGEGGNRTRLLDIGGMGSSQNGDQFAFEPTQIPMQSQLQGDAGLLYGTRIYGQLPTFVPDPPSSSSPASPYQARSAPSAQPPQPRSARPRSSSPRPAPRNAAAAPASGSSGPQIIPDSAQGSELGRSESSSGRGDPALGSKGKERELVVNDPSIVDETRFTDDEEVEEDQLGMETHHPSRAKPVLKEAARAQLPAIEEQDAEREDEVEENVPFVETNYDDPPESISYRTTARKVVASPRRPIKAPPAVTELSSEADIPLAAIEAPASKIVPPAKRGRGRLPKPKGAAVSAGRASSRGAVVEPPQADETPGTNYDEPPVAALAPPMRNNATAKGTSPQNKRRQPHVVVPPAPPVKRARKASTRAQEAAETSRAAAGRKARAKSKEVGPSRAKGKGKVKVKAVGQSSSLTSIDDDGRESVADDAAPLRNYDFAVPALPSRLTESTCRPSVEPGPPICRVLAYWSEDGCFYPGKITAVLTDTVQVEFDDFCLRKLPLEALRLCELRAGDLIRYVGEDPGSQVPGASMSSSQPTFSKVIRVQREVDDEVVVVDGEQERDDVIVACDPDADLSGPSGLHKQYYKVEAVAFPTTSRRLETQLADRCLSKAQVWALKDLMAKQTGVGRRVSAAASSRRISGGSTSSSSTAAAPAYNVNRPAEVVASRRASLPMPRLVKKGTLPTGSPAKGSVLSPILSKYAFLITHTSLDEKPALEQDVRRLGGNIIDQPNELFVCDNYSVDEDEESQSIVKIGFRDSEIARLDGVFLVSDKPVTTFKYLMALALGVPCVSAGWIRACKEERRTLDWLPYSLATGFSAHLKAPVVGLQAYVIRRERHDLEEIARTQYKLRLLSGVSIVCSCTNNPAGEEFGSRFRAILTAMGAERVETTTNVSTYGVSRLSRCDYILVQKTKSKNIDKLPRMPDPPPVVDIDWVKQCLIAGIRLPARKWEPDVLRSHSIEAERANELLSAVK